MADVLDEQTDSTGGPEGAPSETTTEPTTEISPEVQALIDAKTKEATDALRAEYDGPDGHVSRAKSARDKEINRLKKALAEQQTGRLEEAKKLIDTDPARANEILLGLAEQQTQQIAEDDAVGQLHDWQSRVLTDLGADPAEDEDAASLMQEWGPKLLRNPDLTWDFQQAAAQLQIKRERTKGKETEKRLAELESGIEAQIQAAVTKALAGAGIVPEPTPEGQPAASDDESWRENPSVSRGLAKRKAQPVVKKG